VRWKERGRGGGGVADIVVEKEAGRYSEKEKIHLKIQVQSGESSRKVR